MQTIREAFREDAALLAHLIRDSFADVAKEFNLTPENCPNHPTNCTPEWIRLSFEKGFRYFLLENEGEACGCTALEQVGPDIFNLQRLVVPSQHRNKGFGEALIEHVLGLAKRLGATRVQTGIIADHVHLKEWYERHSFVVTRTKHLGHLPFDVTFMAVEL